MNSLNAITAISYDIGNPGPGLGQAQKYGGVKPVNAILLITQISFHSKRPHTLTKMADNININSNCTGNTHKTCN